MTAEDILRRRVRLRTLAHARWERTTEPLYWYGAMLPVGSEFKVFQSANFGFFVLREAFNGYKLFRL